MKKFKGTAICQFNVDVEVEAENAEKAEEEIDKVLDDRFDEDLKIVDTTKNIINMNYDECFEILDIEEVK